MRLVGVLFLLISHGFVESMLSRCDGVYFNEEQYKIIKTDESLANGASILRTLHTTSMQSCKNECCKLHRCTVAIFEVATKNLCYLFDCGARGNLCEFEQHSNYLTSIVLHRRENWPITQRLNTHMPSTMGQTSATSIPLLTQRSPEQRNSNPRPSPAPSSRDKAEGLLAGAATTAAAPVQTGDPNEAVRLDLAERYRQVRAVVLTLGICLAVTLAAVVALGCRLRQLRARIRGGGGGGAGGGSINGKFRGRGVVDDEDYLINGMYL